MVDDGLTGEHSPVVCAIAIRKFKRVKVEYGFAQHVRLAVQAAVMQACCVTHGEAAIHVLGEYDVGQRVDERAQQGSFGEEVLLRAPAFANVVKDDLDQVVIQLFQADLGREGGPVLSTHHAFESQCLSGADIAHAPGVDLAFFLDVGHAPIHAEHLAFRIAQQLATA